LGVNIHAAIRVEIWTFVHANSIPNPDSWGYFGVRGRYRWAFPRKYCRPPVSNCSIDALL